MGNRYCKGTFRIVGGLFLFSFWQTSGIAQTQAGSDVQSLSLFDAVESSAANNNAQNRPNREVRATISEPEFTLVGTSRIGNKYSAIVRHRSGEAVLVRTEGAGNTAIAGHSGYSVVDISSGTVSIRFPGNNACVDFSDLGVRCSSAGNIAELALANAEPLQGIIDEVEVEEVVTDPANPFEALRNNAGAQDENGVGRRFVPRRIDPEDVPEGMRVIATPFGDRLVEE